MNGQAALHQDAVAPSQPHHFRGDIEGLRAVAVGLVLLDHVLGWPSGGFIGVDVFFVISGFLITGLLVRERARTGRISFRAFYVRRARRLLPAAVATLGVTTLAGWLLFVGGRFQNTVTDGLFAFFFSANVHFAQQGTDYFQQTAAPSAFQHFWSLAVEEQFYLLWPVLILAVFAIPLRRAERRTAVLGGVVLLVCAASLAWSVHATATSPATAYFSTFTRAWELGLGALVAVSATQLRRLPVPLAAVLAWLGLAGVLASAFVVTAATPFPGTAAALPVVSTGLLVAFGWAPGGPGVRWALGSRPAGFLGRISYSLYLWHWPVVVVLASVLDPESTGYLLVAIALSLALATISYHVIEQPVLHSHWLLPRPRRARTDADQLVFRRAATVAAAAACVVAVGGSALTLAFPPGRLDPAAVAAANAALRSAGVESDDTAAEDPVAQAIQASTVAVQWRDDMVPSLDALPDYLPEQWRGGCFDVSAENVDDCRFGDTGATQQAVVLGDSIAGAWLPGLRAGLESRGWSVQTLTRGQCPNITATTLVKNQPDVACTEHRDWALDHIEQTRPDLVVLSNADYEKLADPAADKTAVWRAGLTTVIQRSQAAGARVVVLGAPPESANLQSCATSLSAPTDCVQAPSRSFRDQVTRESEVAAATGATYIDVERWFCVDERCPAVIGTTPVFADGVHMTAEYSQEIGSDVVTAVLDQT